MQYWILPRQPPFGFSKFFHSEAAGANEVQPPVVQSANRETFTAVKQEVLRQVYNFGHVTLQWFDPSNPIAERGIIIVGGRGSTSPPPLTQNAPDHTAQDLHRQDRLGNFLISDLVSQSNQAETLALLVTKAQDDTNADILKNI